MLWLCTWKYKILKQDSWFKNITNLLPILREKKSRGEGIAIAKLIFSKHDTVSTNPSTSHHELFSFFSNADVYTPWCLTNNVISQPNKPINVQRAAWRGFIKSGSGVAAVPASGSSCCTQQCLHLTAPSSLSPNSLSHLQGTKSLRSPISLTWTTICSTTLFTGQTKQQLDP